MATVELTKENFETEVSNSSIAIIDFWAPWCGPCKTFAPAFDAVSEEHDDILFGKVNTEEEQELGAHFNIRSIPTLMVIRDNVVLLAQAGSVPKDALEEVIEKSRTIDMEQVHKEVREQQTT